MKSNTKVIDTKKVIFFVTLFSIVALLLTGCTPRLSDDDLQKKIDEGIQKYVDSQKEKDNAPEVPVVVENVSVDDDAVLGEESAPVTLIEFSDYECPFCKRHFTQTHPQIYDKYIKTGKVKMIFRDFPLGFHDPLATKEAMAAECAREQGGDDTYYTYHDLLFQTTTSNGQGLTDAQISELATKAGVDVKKFEECLTSEKYKDEVAKDVADGRSYGVSGTPSFFVNGTNLKGAQPFSAFEAIIEAELAK